MPKVNLIPREEKEKELRRKAYMLPLAGATLLAVTLGGSYYYFNNKLSDAQQEAENYKQKNASIAKQVAELQRYEDMKKQKQARLSAITNIYNQRVRWSRTMDDLAFIVPEEIWLKSIDASVPGAVFKTKDKKSEDKDGGAKDVVIEGYTWEMPSVAVFMVRLGLIPSLSDVSLISAVKEELEGRIVTHFKIGASLKQTQETQKPTTAPSTGEQGPSGVTTTTPTTRTTPTTTTGTTRTTTPPSGGVTP